LAQVGVDPNVNKWDKPFVLGVVDPHDSFSHPAGVSDVQAESATCLDPDLFMNFLVCELYIWFLDYCSLAGELKNLYKFNQILMHFMLSA